MPLFRISLTPSRRAAVRFISHVRRSFQKALAEEKYKRGLTQSAIAKEIGVHRSVINRELTGRSDITVGRIGELAWAMGRMPFFELPENPMQLGMMPIKAASVNIAQSPTMPLATEANQSIIDEWKKQAQATPLPVAA